MIGALALLLSLAAQALPEDRRQPIQIAADQAELDDRQGIATYHGDVRLVQGSMVITADTLTIRTDGKGIQKLTAIGKPAHYQQQTEADQPLTHGYGLRIEYDVERNLVVFIDQARLERASDSFQGERIEIDTARNLVNASSGEGRDKQRVEMVIQPRAPAQ